MAIKKKTVEIKPGKSEFHRFKVPGNAEELNPCICDYNVDFALGCVANVNPYFENEDEILSASVLKLGRGKVLSRLDKLNDNYVAQLDSSLHPEIRRTKDFPEKLKEKIWNIIEAQVSSYQGKTGRQRAPGELTKYFASGIGITDGYSNGCTYCYAGYKNNSQGIILDEVDFSKLEKQVQEITEKLKGAPKHLGKDKMIIRMGKDTEAASLLHLNHLLELFKICKPHGVAFHIPTKFLPYDETIADHLRESESSVGYSFGYEKLEKGTVLFGFDNAYKLHCAKRYADNGVNVFLRMSLDCTVSLEECEKNGGNINQIRSFLEDNPHIGRQLIPMRMQKKKDIFEITGHTKTKLQGNPDLFTSEAANPLRFSQDKRQVLHPEIVHPDFLEFFTDPDDPVRKQQQRSNVPHICAGVGGKFYCDSCQLKGMPFWKLSEENTIPVTFRKTSRAQERKNWVSKKQKILPEM